MSQDSSVPEDPASGRYDNHRLNVAFEFDSGWQIITPDGTSSFPPGGGLTPHDIVIQPLDLTGLTASAASAAILQRSSDLATIAQALALAQLQFVAAQQALQSAQSEPDE